MDPKEMIAALAVLADANASDEDKAAALDKLTAYFNAQLDGAEGSEKPEEASEAPKGDDEHKDEQASEAGAPKDEPKDPEKDSALAKALEELAALKSRMAKIEKASAVGHAPRAAKPTILPCTEPAPPKDHVTSMIEAAARNTLRNLPK